MGQFTDPGKAIELLRPGHTFAEVSPSGAALILAELERRGSEVERLSAQIAEASAKAVEVAQAGFDSRGLRDVEAVLNR